MQWKRWTKSSKNERTFLIIKHRRRWSGWLVNYVPTPAHSQTLVHEYGLWQLSAVSRSTVSFWLLVSFVAPFAGEKGQNRLVVEGTWHGHGWIRPFCFQFATPSESFFSPPTCSDSGQPDTVMRL